jgi:hypothetical protein
MSSAVVGSSSSVRPAFATVGSDSMFLDDE